MDFIFAMWNSTKVKFSEIIRFVHISFLARLYYNFLNNLVAILFLTIIVSISYYFIKSKINTMDKAYQERVQNISLEETSFKEQVLSNLQNNESTMKLVEIAKSKYKINKMEDLICIGIISQNLKDDKFKIFDFNMKIEGLNRYFNSKKKHSDKNPLISSFNSMFFSGRAETDELFRMIAFFQDHKILDDQGIINMWINRFKDHIPYIYIHQEINSQGSL